MYIASAVIFLLMFIPIGLAKNIVSGERAFLLVHYADKSPQETVLIARFISGVAASTGGTLVGGTVADLFDAADRGLPMSLYSFCA